MLLWRCIVVTATGVPPPAGTRYNGPRRKGPKTIVPSRFQVPPHSKRESQRTWTVPLVVSTVLRRLSAKNPIWRLSGDQKGKPAPSVPLSCWAVEPERTRTHSVAFPSGPSATNAKRDPSGEIAKLEGRKEELGGGRSEERTN